MEKQTVLYFSQVVLFSIFPLYFVIIKSYFRNNIFYVYLGIVLSFGGFLGQIWSVNLTDTIKISGGNIAYAAFMMTAILFVVLERDITITRSIIKLVIIVNVFKYFLFNSIFAILKNPIFNNPFDLTPNLFSSSGAIMITGGILIILELVIFLMAFEKIKKVSNRPLLMNLLFIILFVFLLCLDGTLFPLINFRLFPDLTPIIIGGIKNKIILGISFAPMLFLILMVFRKRFEHYLTTDIQLKDILKKSKEDLASVVQQQINDLKENEKKYRTLYETMTQGVVYQDINGLILSANPAAQTILGLPLDQMAHQTSESYMWKTVDENGEILSGNEYPAMLALKTGEPIMNFTMGVFNPTKQGYVWLSINAIPQFMEGEKEPYQVYTIFEDITSRKKSESILNLNMARYEKAQEMGKVGNWECNIADETFWGSKEANRLFGLNPESKVHSIEDVENKIMEKDRVHKALEELLLEDKRYDLTYELYPNEKQEKTIIHSVAELIKSDSGEPFKIIGVVQDITESKNLESKLIESREKLRQLAVYLQKLREDDRVAIAREIHDDFGQTLSALKMDLGWMAKRMTPDMDEVSVKIEGMKNHIDKTVQSVKRLCSELRPEILDDLGLAEALKWQIGQFSERSGLECHLNIDKNKLQIDKELSTCIFRMVQESLTNVSRHADAKTVWISILNELDAIILIIKDDGRGIHEDVEAPNLSFGIIGMQERVYSYNGKFEITGKPGNGTIVSATFPIHEKSV